MPRTKDKYTVQFYINVNNIVRQLLRDDILFTTESASSESLRLIRDSLGISQRQAQRYLRAARDEIRKITAASAKESLDQAFRDRHFIILQSKKDGDLKLALEAMKDREKLKGLYEDTVIHKGEVAVTFVEKLDE